VEERLQKVLARAGVASRRKAEELIAAGRVEVNSKVVTELGTKVDPKKDLVRVDGKLIAEAESPVYLVLYKPAGVVTTLSDPEGRPTVASLLKGVTERIYPVGRLDYDAEGALLLTNDGPLAHQPWTPASRSTPSATPGSGWWWTRVGPT
jgi:16S rRNA U516 pseudouridylate synthase RsuA-like enzyme